MEGDNNECIGLDLISDLPNFDFLSSFENESNEDSPYSNLEIDCKYLSETQFIQIYNGKQPNKSLSFLSLNCQGLNSKFSEINEFNNNLKSLPNLHHVQIYSGPILYFVFDHQS